MLILSFLRKKLINIFMKQAVADKVNSLINHLQISQDSGRRSVGDFFVEFLISGIQMTW